MPCVTRTWTLALWALLVTLSACPGPWAEPCEPQALPSSASDHLLSLGTPQFPLHPTDRTKCATQSRM